MTHEEQNIGGGAEHPGSDEQKVSLMLSGLKRVEAPKDFDFHLKARIAKGRPEEIRPASLFPILKYALPLALVLFVSAGLLLRSSYNSWEEPTVAETTAPQPPPTSRLDGPKDPVNTVSVPAPVSSDNNRTSSDDAFEVATDSKKPASGGSKDFINRPDRPLILPGAGSVDKAISAPTPRNPPGTGQKKYTAREGLEELLGVVADFENGNWVAKSLKPNMPGDNVGVKTGDRIIALDGKPIDDKTKFDGGVSVTTIRVSRDGKILELDSKSKPK